MKHASEIFAAFLLVLFTGAYCICPAQTGPMGMDKVLEARIAEDFGKLPLSFEENQGRMDEKVRFFSRGKGYTLFLTPEEAVLALQKPEESRDRNDPLKERPSLRAKKQDVGAEKGAIIRMRLSGAKIGPQVAGEDILPGVNNYFIGKEASKWRTGSPSHARVRYKDVYPGIDLVFYGNQSCLEYDFVVSPGADPSRIDLVFFGADKIDLDKEGNLLLQTAAGDVIQKAPVIYQEKDGKREPVCGGYRIDEKGRIGFQLASWDRERELVIDPILVFSTFFGGNFQDFGSGIAVDAAGNAYVMGTTEYSDLPAVNALYPYNNGSYDAFVLKLSPDGTQVIYATYFGGSTWDFGNGIAVDDAGNVVVTGYTDSTDFPVLNAVYPDYRGGYYDGFVFKLNSAGNQIVYSTFLGGSATDYANGIAVDSAGNAYVTGDTESLDFPMVNALYPNLPAGQYIFIFKLDADGAQVYYSTLFGGNSGNLGSAIAVDGAGNAYVTGLTYSTDFPLVNALYPHGGVGDAFIFKLNAAGNQVIYSTCLGGSNEEWGHGIAVDGVGNAYVTGYTDSADFPLVNALYPYGGAGDAFIFKLSQDGTQAVYSTYLGGSYTDCGWGIAADGAGNAYVTGQTVSSDFPMVNSLYPYLPSLPVYEDAYVFKLNADGSQVCYSTYLGGSMRDSGRSIAVDSAGNAYVTGYTISSDFPAKNALYPNYHFQYGYYYDAFITKISPVRQDYAAEDLEGTWHMHTLASGAGAPWWEYGAIVVRRDGTFTGTFYEYDSSAPDEVSGQLRIDAGGVVSFAGAAVDHLQPGFKHGHMTIDKNAIAMIATFSTGSPETTQIIMMTRQGSDYQQPDLAGIWQLHSLASGDGAPRWAYGPVVAGRDGMFSGTVHQYNNGVPINIQGQLQMDAAGVVTETGGTGVPHGHLAADRDIIAIVDTWTGSATAELRVVTRQGHNYQTSDLAGTWQVHALASGPGEPWWEYGAVTIESDGTFSGTLQEYNSSGLDGVAGQLHIDGDGIITAAGGSQVPHGHLAADRNIIVMVDTWTNGAPGSSEIRVLTRSSAISRPGDLDLDGDVDGMDLDAFAHQMTNGTNTIGIGDFAANFGRAW